MITENMGAGFNANGGAPSRAGTNYLTVKEEKKLFKTIKSRKEKQAERDFVLFKLCRLTGLRRGEALALNVGDIRGKDLLILTAQIAEKGAVGTVHLPVELQDIFTKFLRLKKTWGESIDSDAALFISKKGRRLAGRTVIDSMAKWCAEAGIPCYTPHAWRHTKAHRILDDTSNIDPDERHKTLLFIQAQLRHKTIASTGIYLKPSRKQMASVAGI